MKMEFKGPTQCYFLGKAYSSHVPHGSADSYSSDGNTSRGTRRNVPESGSFGKSRRRSRSKTSGTPARREDPAQQAGDAVFTKYFAEQATARAQSPQRKQSLPTAVSQPNLSSQATGALSNIDGNAGPLSRYVHKEPTELILRGFEENQDYAAIGHYERLAGRICEDYPRDPPLEQRRYKSDLRDQTSLRTVPLSAEEKAKVRNYAGGKHWIKITFESAEAAEAALFSSPQIVLGHYVFAEPYNQLPPTILEAMPASGSRNGLATQSLGASSLFSARSESRPSSANLPRSFTTPAMSQIGRMNQSGQSHFSPSDSLSSSTTLDSATVSTATVSSSSATVKGSPARESQSVTTQSQQKDKQDSQFCSRIPTAKRATLLPASQALLPQQTLTQRITSHIPLVSWLSKDVIGNQVPRTENGDFDWAMASFYWRLCWFLDFWFRWMNGELVGTDKDE